MLSAEKYAKAGVQSRGFEMPEVQYRTAPNQGSGVASASAAVATAAAAGVVASTGSVLLAVCVILSIPVAIAGLVRPAHTAMVLLVASPLLLSTFAVGPVTLDNVVTVGGMGIAVLAAVHRRALPFVGLSALPLLAALAIVITSLILGVPFLPEVVRFLGLAMLPWLVVSSNVKSTFTRLTLLWVVGLGAVSLLLQPLTGYPSLTQDTETALLRQGGLFGHPNFAAYCLALGLILLVLQPRMNRWDLAIAAVFAAALVVSGARTATVVLVATLALLLLSQVGRLAALIGMSIPIVIVIGPTLIERFAALSSPAGVGGSNAMTWRLNQWSMALEISAENRLVGIGFQRTESLMPNGLGAHNGYVEILAELGVSGFVLIAVGVLVAASTTKISRASVGAWTFVLISSATDPVLLYPSSLLMLLVILAMERKKSQDSTCPG